MKVKTLILTLAVLFAFTSSGLAGVGDDYYMYPDDESWAKEYHNTAPAPGGFIWIENESDGIAIRAQSDLGIGLEAVSNNTGLALHTVGSSVFEGDVDVFGKVVMDSLNIPTGATEGHVLTADATGRGTWQAVPDSPGVIDDYSDGTYAEITAATQRSTTSTSFVKLKELSALARGGTISISWEQNRGLGGGVTSQVYTNGSPVGSPHGDIGWATITETGLTVSPGDVISIYGKATGGGENCMVRNMKLLCSNPQPPVEVL